MPEVENYGEGGEGLLFCACEYLDDAGDEADDKADAAEDIEEDADARHYTRCLAALCGDLRRLCRLADAYAW